MVMDWVEGMGSGGGSLSPSPVLSPGPTKRSLSGPDGAEAEGGVTGVKRPRQYFHMVASGNIPRSLEQFWPGMQYIGTRPNAGAGPVTSTKPLEKPVKLPTAPSGAALTVRAPSPPAKRKWSTGRKLTLVSTKQYTTFLNEDQINKQEDLIRKMKEKQVASGWVQRSLDEYLAEEEQKKAENFAKEAKELAAAKENVLKEDEVKDYEDTLEVEEHSKKVDALQQALEEDLMPGPSDVVAASSPGSPGITTPELDIAQEGTLSGTAAPAKALCTTEKKTGQEVSDADDIETSAEDEGSSEESEVSSSAAESDLEDEKEPGGDTTPEDSGANNGSPAE